MFSCNLLRCSPRCPVNKLTRASPARNSCRDSEVFCQPCVEQVFRPRSSRVIRWHPHHVHSPPAWAYPWSPAILRGIAGNARLTENRTRFPCTGTYVTRLNQGLNLRHGDVLAVYRWIHGHRKPSALRLPTICEDVFVRAKDIKNFQGFYF